MKTLKKMDASKVARAVEDDAGHALPGLRESLVQAKAAAQAKAGTLVRVHTPEEIAGRRRGRPEGSRQEVTKEAVKIRLDADVMSALRASGDGWQTRINDAPRIAGSGRKDRVPVGVLSGSGHSSIVPTHTPFKPNYRA